MGGGFRQKSLKIIDKLIVAISDGNQKKYSLDYDVNRLLEEYRKKVNDVYDRINLNENIEEIDKNLRRL